MNNAGDVTFELAENLGIALGHAPALESRSAGRPPAAWPKS